MNKNKSTQMVLNKNQLAFISEAEGRQVGCSFCEDGVDIVYDNVFFSEMVLISIGLVKTIHKVSTHMKESDFVRV